jgi:hypothetical protein
LDQGLELKLPELRILWMMKMMVRVKVKIEVRVRLDTQMQMDMIFGLDRDGF